MKRTVAERFWIKVDLQELEADTMNASEVAGRFPDPPPGDYCYRDGTQMTFMPTAERDATQGALTEALRLLRSVEWDANDWCPVCGWNKSEGHDSCILGAFLAAHKETP